MYENYNKSVLFGCTYKEAYRGIMYFSSVLSWLLFGSTYSPTKQGIKEKAEEKKKGRPERQVYSFKARSTS